MAAATVRVRGLRELNRDFRKLDRALARDLQGELKRAAEPVRVAAQELATGQISHIGPRWSQMRTGSTTRSVYVAPAARRRGGSPRPNLGGLLFNAMSTALDRERDRIVEEVDQLLGRLAGGAGF